MTKQRKYWIVGLLFASAAAIVVLFGGRAVWWAVLVCALASIVWVFRAIEEES
jgi:hypothetical protein